MAPSAAQAQGYERVSKYPKSTKYGRQNPITERWNSDEQLVLWRAAWADVANRHLERTGHEERIDHRSHAERGLLERPTVHEGVAARAMEKKGIISDRCELNRQIKADNALLRKLRGQVKKLAMAVKNTIPALAEAMEQSLKRLEEQEQKYSAELDAALNEYAVLREQTKGFDPVQLYEARQAIRPGKEQEAENRAQQVYGEKYSPLLMFDIKKAVSRMLHEDMERQAVRRMVWQAQKEQQTFQKKKSKERER